MNCNEYCNKQPLLTGMVGSIPAYFPKCFLFHLHCALCTTTMVIAETEGLFPNHRLLPLQTTPYIPKCSFHAWKCVPGLEPNLSQAQTACATFNCLLFLPISHYHVEQSTFQHPHYIKPSQGLECCPPDHKELIPLAQFAGHATALISVGHMTL